MLVLLKIRSINAFKHKSGEFTFVTIYISGFNNKSFKVYSSISCKLPLIKRLKVNILVSNNILYIEGFSINIYNTSVLLYYYNVKIDISTKYHFKFLKQRVLNHSSILITFCSKALVTF